MNKQWWIVALTLLIPTGCAASAKPLPARGEPTVPSTKTPEGGSGVTPKLTARPAPFHGRTGDVGVLRAGENDVLAGASEAALDRLIKLSSARDGMGVAQLVLAGQVLVIKPGTHARLIDGGFMTHEVRILEGTHAGRSVFIPVEFLVAE
jgi:hypothetical protein